MKITGFWDIAPCSVAEVECVLLMAAVRNSEMPVCFNETIRRYIPETCNFQMKS
jgi:hypothetical protein